MVDRQLAFSLLQLVVFSLPAFAILLQIVVEANIPYTHWAVPTTTAGLGLFLVAGTFVLGELFVTTDSAVATLVLGILILGMICLLIGASAIGLQTGFLQWRHMDAND